MIEEPGSAPERPCSATMSSGRALVQLFAAVIPGAHPRRGEQVLNSARGREAGIASTSDPVEEIIMTEWVDVTGSHHRRRYVTSRSSFQGPLSTDSREVPLIVRSPSAKESGSRCAHPGSSNAHSQPSGLMETS
jgi:hypothetical protein